MRTRAVVYCGGGVSEVEVPDGTERIEDFAFYCAGITKVSLPEGLKHIGEEAFCFATKLKEAHLPKSVETVDASAFYACDELQSVTLPASVKSLEKLCFAFCSSLKSMIVLSTTPPTLPAIGGDDDAFWYTDLSHTTLYVPQESLEQYKADQGWSRFQTIVGVPKPDAQVLIVTTTDGARTEFLLEEQPKVYNRGTNLEITSRATTITLPLSKLKRMTFRPADGTSINEVKKDGSDKESPREMLNFSQLPPRSKIEVFASDGRLLKSERTCNASSALNLDELGRGLFIVRINGVTYTCCKNLASVQLPRSISTLPLGMFEESGLKHITIPSNIKTIDLDCFENCTSLESVTFSNGLKEIGSSAFKNCSKLITLELPSTVENIGALTFKGCSCLESIVLPHNYKYVGNAGSQTFGGCINLKKVYAHMTSLRTDLRADMFETYDATLYVPRGLKDLYSATLPWSQFKNIVEANYEE